jgi:Fe-S-cluster-containing dehydrogenase component
MEEKVIVYDPVLCTGCMRCMTTCSTYNFGATSFSKSRIHMIRHEGYAITRMDEEDDLIFHGQLAPTAGPSCLASTLGLAIGISRFNLRFSHNSTGRA